MKPYVEWFVGGSAKARAELPCTLDVRFGPTRDETLDMHHSADGSGAFVQGESEQVRILEVTQFLQQHGIERIDLLKVNIEGGEYELLEHLIATGDIRKVRKLQVQFHDFVPDAIPRRARILQGLAQTHAQHWNFHFVWEEWGLKPELA